MQHILEHFTTTDLLAMGLGLLLVFAGRRLYWLALGGVGFYIGLALAARLFPGNTNGMELGLAFLLAIAGAVLAILAQRMAVGLGGFLLGGVGGLWLASFLAPILNIQHEMWVWLFAALGAVIGVSVAAALFDAALVLISALAGAALIASRSHLVSPQDHWLFLVLAALGLIAQSTGGTKERDRDDDDD
jgi:hypothetical protein